MVGVHENVSVFIIESCCKWTSESIAAPVKVLCFDVALRDGLFSLWVT